ncbi:MAG: hypothetical protein ACOWWM_10100 [Desulfobacterales bacterium]
MKSRILTLIVVVTAAVLGFSPEGRSATVASTVFEESFLGSVGDADYFSMAETSLLEFGTGNSARFSFDLTGIGGEARLINTDSTGMDRIVETRNVPSVDAVGYDPSLYRPFSSAVLSVYVSDTDGGNQNLERLRIDFLFGNGTRQTILSDIFQVNDANNLFVSNIDLAAGGWLDELSDGTLVAFALAPPYGSVDNDFILDKVSLTAQTTAVPIPGSVVLLGSGLLGIVLSRRRPA